METKTRQNDTYIPIIELHPFEMELIRTMRKSMRFGEITIIMRDGLPVRIKRIMEIAELSTPSS